MYVVYLALILIWRFDESCQINYAIIEPFKYYIASMGFFPYRTEIRQFKILPIALFEQIAKYSTRQ